MEIHRQGCSLSEVEILHPWIILVSLLHAYCPSLFAEVGKNNSVATIRVPREKGIERTISLST